ncbi:MAG: DUF2029 domain-containing protein [Chloroflexaceae bacterium]|nr:DUF2029 domain-containing protein [Chloroflexaceae bacterium]
MRKRKDHRFTLNVVSLVLAGGWLLLVGQTLDPSIDDFERYWQAAVDLRQAGDPYVTRADYFYPPFFVYLMQPFGYLGHQQGQWVWFGLNVLALGGFLALSIRLSRAELPRRFWGVVALGMVVAPPTRLTLQLGQISLVLALAVVGIAALEHRAALLSGLLLALASLVRLNPAFLGIYYLLRRPRSVAWWSIGMGVALVVLSLLVYGPTHYANYLDTIVRRNVDRQGAYPYAAEHNISLFGFWSRMLTLNRHAVPLLDAPLLAYLLTALLSLGVVGLCLWVGRREPGSDGALLGFGVWVCGMMLLLPTNGYYNLVILLLPLLAVVRHLEQHRTPRTPWVRAWLVLATALIWVPPGWTSAHPWLYASLHTGWGLLALTPSFYGVLIFMGLLAVLAQGGASPRAGCGGRESVVGGEERRANIPP